MDTVRFISECLDQVQIRLMATCKGLTPDQVLWRPAPTANNIGFILWHVARNEDARLTQTGGLAVDLWRAENWYSRFGQPADSPDPGDRLGFRSLAIPGLDVLLAYSDAVHQRTLSFLETLAASRLDDPVDPSQLASSVGGSLLHLITHKNNHHGQVDYLRGLQEESWDLPRGTGAVLP